MVMFTMPRANQTPLLRFALALWTRFHPVRSTIATGVDSFENMTDRVRVSTSIVESEASPAGSGVSALFGELGVRAKAASWADLQRLHRLK